MYSRDWFRLLLVSFLCWMPIVAQAEEILSPVQRTLIMRQPPGKKGEAVVSVRVCMQGGYAVLYHHELDRYGNYVHPPAVFNLDTESWWDQDKRSWVTKKDWTQELKAVKSIAARKFSAAKDSKRKEFLQWSLEPKYAIERDGGAVQLSSEWVKCSVTEWDKVTKDELAHYFCFHRLTLIRNSLDHKKGLPFVDMAVDDVLIEENVLPKKTIMRYVIGSHEFSAWTECEFRDATANEMSESSSVLASLPQLPTVADRKKLTD